MIVKEFEGSRVFLHKDYKNMRIYVYGNEDQDDNRDVKVCRVISLHRTMEKIYRLDKERSEEENEDRIAYFEKSIEEAEYYTDDEIDSITNSETVKEFKEKYGMDVTKELYIEELDGVKDIRYHGIHKGYKMFTYVNEFIDLVARCPVLDICIPNYNYKDENDIRIMIEELKDVIDWYTDDIKEDGAGYWSPFLEKNIEI